MAPSLQPILNAAISLLPVTLFLSGLIVLDSYKLVHARTVITTILAGCGAALVAYFGNSLLAASLRIDWVLFIRYVSPVIEETLKGLYLLYMLKSNKLGFMMDAAIVGFAVGAGFSMVENLFYIHERPDADVYLWVIRGFGTAVMHGGTTAIVGIIAKQLTDRWGGREWIAMLPGLGLAFVIHSAFNHFFVNPLLSTVLVLVTLPALVMFIFRQSERATQSWLGVGFDSDRELLDMITTGTLAENRIGNYLHSLQDRFPGEVVADMLCYLRVHLELSVRAKGLLLLRESGFEIPPDPETRDQLNELTFLERSIGRTGLMALHPFLHMRRKDLWQITMLK